MVKINIKQQSWAWALTRVRLRVWQKLLFVCLFVFVLTLLGTAVVDLSRVQEPEKPVTASGSGWPDSVTGYVVADEGAVEVELLTEGLGPMTYCGRGLQVELENWDVFLSDDGKEYYHIYYEGQYGYIPVSHIASSADRVLRESQIYVCTATNLYTDPDGIELGLFLDKGTALNVLGYDYLDDDGSAHMYQVKCGDATGWIRSEYVAMNFLDSMANYAEADDAYLVHTTRGDTFGGGDPEHLDYFPRLKGDFSAYGNTMPESCYCLYVPCTVDAIGRIDEYLEFAKNTEINTFVFTIQEDSEIAWPFASLEKLGILSAYKVKCTAEEYAAVVKKVTDAGYYTVARMTCFQDDALATNCPSMAVVSATGDPVTLGVYRWPSPCSREVWQVKAETAIEAVESFGFNEIQLDYVQFTYGMGDVEDAGGDVRNYNGEQRAQVLQRFVMYMTDVLHDHHAYVSAVTYGETAEPHINSYGLYWASFSNVVDVICATPYPDSYPSYWTSKGMYYPSRHPYDVIDTWAAKIVRRQTECPTPAKVRTWIQSWDMTYYEYDNAAIEREVLALYDNDLTDGYAPWTSYGSMDTYRKMEGVFKTDYYELWQQAEQQEKTLSAYMGVSTSDEKVKEEDADE